MSSVHGFYENLLIHEGDSKFAITVLAGSLNLRPERAIMTNIPGGKCVRVLFSATRIASRGWVVRKLNVAFTREKTLHNKELKNCQILVKCSWLV